MNENQLRMKKVIIATSIVVATTLVALALLPFFFKGALIDRALNALNRNLQVEVGFNRLQISLFREFPRASLQLDGVTLTGKGAFLGDTLLTVAQFRTSVGMFDLFTPRHLTLLELLFYQPDLRLKVNGENVSNWQIIAENQPLPASGEEEGEPFGLDLNRIEIHQGRLIYTDETLPMEMLLGDVSLAMRGDLSGQSTRLDTRGLAEHFSLSYNGTTYLSRLRLGVETQLDIDFDRYHFTFSDAKLLVNRLPLDLTGHFSMPDDSMLFDFRFSSGNSTLSEILALIPPDYEHYLEGIAAAGEAQVNGRLHGHYLDEDYPAFDLKLKVASGLAQYAGMPADVRNIAASVEISKPQGSMNATSIVVSEARCDIRNNPIQFRLALSNLLEDLKFDTDFTGKLNFSDLRDALPFVTEGLSGVITFDLKSRGNYSDVVNRHYDRMHTAGNAQLSGLHYSGEGLTMPVSIPSGQLVFAPSALQLQQLQVIIGESNMNVTGRITDYYEWLLSDGNLKGSVALTSDRLNFDQLMQLVEAKDEKETLNSAEGIATPFEVPENWDMRIDANVRQAIYDQMSIGNIRGAVTLSNGEMVLNGLTMEMLDGTLQLAGSYKNAPDLQPLVDLKLDIVRFDIPASFQSLGLVRHYIPIAAHSRGRFGTSMVFSGKLGSDMKLIMPSLNGSGKFTTVGIQILDSPIFNQIKSVLSEERLRNVTIDDFIADFTIEKGNLLLPPFETRIAGQQAVFTGSLNTQNLLQMQATFLVNRNALSSNIERMIGLLPGQQNIQLLPVGFTLNGPVKNPEVKVDLSEATQMVKNEVMNATREELQRSINRLGEGLRRFLP